MADFKVDYHLTTTQKARIEALFGTDAEKQHLPAIASAALAEYVAMLTGDEVPRRHQDVLQSRLRWLIERYLKGHFPSEADVASWFKLTETQARTLLANTKARFEFESRQWTVDAIRRSLVDEKNEPSDWEKDAAPAMFKLVIPKILLPELRAAARSLEPSKQIRVDGDFTLVDRELLARLLDHYDVAIPEKWKKFPPFKK